MSIYSNNINDISLLNISLIIKIQLLHYFQSNRVIFSNGIFY